MYLISADKDLNLLKECPRCFWLNYKSRVPRPASEPSAFDGAVQGVLHEYFDRYRGELPPELRGVLEGCLLADGDLIEHWRHWRKGLRHSDPVMSAVLYGAMDDCLVADDLYMPIECRLVSREPYESEVKERESYIDSLTYLLTANGYKTPEFGYVVYYFPEPMMKNHAVALQAKAVRVDTDLIRAERLFYGAADLLRRRNPPEEDPDCRHCAWSRERSSFERAKK